MASLDDNFNIETPENIKFAYQVAGIGSRFLAALVDTVFLIILEIFLYVILSKWLNFTLDILFDSPSAKQVWTFAIVSFLMFVLYWGYYIFFEMYWNGQSLGKFWTKLRVMRIDGTPITFTDSIIRNILRLVDFLPIGYAVGVVTMLFNDQSRRLGDLAAGTLVVHDRLDDISAYEKELFPRRMLLKRVKNENRPKIEGFGPLPVEELLDEDINLAVNFLLRREASKIAKSMDENVLGLLLKRMDVPLEYITKTHPYGLIRDIVGFSHYLNPSDLDQSEENPDS